jgi:DNA-directed RNA polymerase specialized sigma24 family protein
MGPQQDHHLRFPLPPIRHFEDLSNDEVAEVLGLKKAAASNRYVRALKRLKDILSETGFDELA